MEQLCFDFEQYLDNITGPIFEKWSKTEISLDDLLESIPETIRHAVVVVLTDYKLRNDGWLGWAMDFSNSKVEEYYRNALVEFSQYNKSADNISDEILSMIEQASYCYHTLEHINYGDYLDVIQEYYGKSYDDLHQLALELFNENPNEWLDKAREIISSDENIDEHKLHQMAVDLAYEHVVDDKLHSIRRQVYYKVDCLNEVYYRIRDKFLAMFVDWLKTQIEDT